MKDSNNIELVRGDLVMLTIDTPIHHPAELVIFLDIEEYVFKVTEDGEERTETTKTLHYYPLTKEGLEVANYDAGVEQLKFHRQQKYTASNICPVHLLKVDGAKLNGYAKTVFDEISALL